MITANPECSRKTKGDHPCRIQLWPRIERFEEECWFVLPALAFSMKDGFAIATGWLKWHVEIKWTNAAMSDGAVGKRES